MPALCRTGGVPIHVNAGAISVSRARTFAETEPSTPTITYAGIGDEAGPSLRDQLDALGRLGWSSIEMRTVDGVPLARIGERAFNRLCDSLAVRGVTVACVASQIGGWARAIDGDFGEDLDELATLARRCAALGTSFIRIMSWPNAGLEARDWQRRVLDRIRTLADRAEATGVVLLHENCSGWAGTRAEAMVELVDAVGSPALALLFDTGNGVAHGYRAPDLLTRIVGLVAHVHVKDGRRTGRNVAYTLPGEGSAGIAVCLRLLLASGYTGTWSIEPHLGLRPHERRRTVAPRSESFVASGMALDRLVREHVLPGLPGFRAAAGGKIVGDASTRRR